MIKFKIKGLLKPLIAVFIILVVLFFIIDGIVMPFYVQKGKITKVPNVVGMPLEDAKKKIREAGLDPKKAEYKAEKKYEIGTVISQNPSAESEVKYGRGIYLIVSGGEDLVEVPGLRGKSIREATFSLERHDLKIGNISYEPSDEIFENTIIRQTPPAKAKIREGGYIDVVVSQGKGTNAHLIPDVSMKTLTEAEKILTNAGFQVGKVTYQINMDLLPNTVLEQYPRAGELIQLGQAVDLIVAQKAELKTKDEH
jgi:beta-lactam-binding protein with PASTA domain